MAKSMQEILRDAGPLPTIPDTTQTKGFGIIPSPERRAKRKFTPVSNQVVFQQLAPPSTTLTGKLILPEQSQDKYYTPECVAVAVGPDCKQVKDGDVFLLRPGRYGNVVYDGDEMLFCVEVDILGIVDQPSK